MKNGSAVAVADEEFDAIVVGSGADRKSVV